MSAGLVTLEDALAEEQKGFKLYTADALLRLDIPPRELVVDPILPERGLAMLYAARGIGKTFVSLTLAHAIATGGRALRWHAPRPRRVCVVDGEMPLVALQERLAAIIAGGDGVMPDPNYLTLLAADAQEKGLPDLSTDAGWDLIEPVIAPAIAPAEVIVLDNLSTLARSGNENEAESWGVMQQRLLRLRRGGKTVLLVHHAGKGGGQRGTSRREDVLDTVIALRWPSDYRPDQGCRFEVALEKARGIAGGDAAKGFEASLEMRDGAARWATRDIADVELTRATGLFAEGLSVRDVAEEMGISKSKAHRLRKLADAG
jgi:putative DNA primase/helicase